MYCSIIEKSESEIAVGDDGVGFRADLGPLLVSLVKS